MSEPGGKQGELLPLLALMLLGAACAVAIYVPREEDAFIYYRYALHWARGLGLVFNPGERTEGFSSPLWMWVAGAIARLGWILPVAVPAAGIGCGVATVAATWRLACRVGLDRWGRLAAPAGLALSYPFLYWSRSGLETPFYSLLLVLTANLYLAAEHAPCVAPGRRARLRLAGGAALGLLGMARPEGLLLLPLVVVDRLVDRRDRRGAARYLVAAAVVYGSFLVWRYQTYGSLVANTSVRFDPLLAGRAARQLGGYVLQLGLLPPLLPALAWWTMRRPRPDQHRAVAFLLAMVGVLSVLFQLAAGGEYRGEFRYLVPTLPFLLVAIWWSAERLEIPWWSARRPFAAWPGRTLLLGLLLAGSLTRIAQDLPAAGEWQPLARQWTVDVDDPSDWRVVTSRWLAPHLPDGSLVALGQMGRIPYYLAVAGRDVAFVDTLGLVDRQVAATYRLDHKLVAMGRALLAGRSLDEARRQGRHEREARFTAYVLGRRPDLILIELVLERSRRLQTLVLDPGFKACYREVVDLPLDQPMVRVFAPQRSLPGACPSPAAEPVQGGGWAPGAPAR
jgi:arabinofuranosyltransferase